VQRGQQPPDARPIGKEESETRNEKVKREKVAQRVPPEVSRSHQIGAINFS
jgi:hypothetical protein